MFLNISSYLQILQVDIIGFNIGVEINTFSQTPCISPNDSIVSSIVLLLFVLDRDTDVPRLVSWPTLPDTFHQPGRRH